MDTADRKRILWLSAAKILLAIVAIGFIVSLLVLLTIRLETEWYKTDESKERGLDSIYRRVINVNIVNHDDGDGDRSSNEIISDENLIEIVKIKTVNDLQINSRVKRKTVSDEVETFNPNSFERKSLPNHSQEQKLYNPRNSVNPKPLHIFNQPVVHSFEFDNTGYDLKGQSNRPVDYYRREDTGIVYLPSFACIICKPKTVKPTKKIKGPAFERIRGIKKIIFN